jgi:glycosyltransferase involved in cell wall biosynthesis
MLYCFLHQDYDNKELIIINDQGNVEYVYDDKRVIIFNLKERFSSLGMKRNFSKDKANGEFIFFTDDDDIYYSNHISRLINVHKDNMDYDIVMNDFCQYSIDNVWMDNWYKYMPFNGVCFKRDYVLNNYFPHYLSCAEDELFVENATKFRIKDDITTFNYRWGLDAFHISGLGGTGIESYEMVGNQVKGDELKTIILKPQISEGVKGYYK